MKECSIQMKKFVSFLLASSMFFPLCACSIPNRSNAPILSSHSQKLLNHCTVSISIDTEQLQDLLDHSTDRLALAVTLHDQDISLELSVN